MPFQEGNQHGNRNGRPKNPEIQLFRDAIAEVEGTKGKKLMVHAVERAFAEDTVLVALLKKILPDKFDASTGDLDDETKKLVESKLNAYIAGLLSKNGNGNH